MSGAHLARTRATRKKKYGRRPRDNAGELVWHSSGPDNGPDVGREVGLGGGVSLWCGEISRDRWEEGGPEVAELGNDFGQWLILYTPKEAFVIGRIVNDEAADALANHVSAALIKAKRNAA